MYTYTINGQVNYNNADNDSGNATVDVSETVIVDEMSAQTAKDAFFAHNEQYDDFFGTAKTCDAETAGGKGATYKDNDGLVIDVDLVNA